MTVRAWDHTVGPTYADPILTRLYQLGYLIILGTLVIYYESFGFKKVRFFLLYFVNLRGRFHQDLWIV